MIEQQRKVCDALIPNQEFPYAKCHRNPGHGGEHQARGEDFWKGGFFYWGGRMTIGYLWVADGQDEQKMITLALESISCGQNQEATA